MDAYFVLCGAGISIFRCDVVVAAAVATSFRMVCSIRYDTRSVRDGREKKKNVVFPLLSRSSSIVNSSWFS